MSAADENDNFVQDLGSNAKYLGKVSAADENDNFEQNLGLGEHFGKKNENFCLGMSAIDQNDNF